MEDTDKGATKNEIKHRGIRAMPFVIGNETFEKLGTVGSSSNLLVYLTSIFHLKSITATNIINIFNGTCNFGTLLGAFLSDTYFGRYNILGFASVSSFLGMLVLTITAGVSKLHPPECGKAAPCVGPTAGQMTFLLGGFGLLVIGASGIRPCNLAFGADQFDPKTESGRRGISSFFNWYYFTYTFAVMVSLTVIVYVQSSISWSLGLAIPTIMMFLSCTLFFVGTKIYVRIVPKGSPLSSVTQVLVAAFKKRHLQLPQQLGFSLFNYMHPNSLNSMLPYTDQFRFLSKAAVITQEDLINSVDGSAANPWRLCSIQQVEEAIQTDTQLGHINFHIPPASFIVISMLSITIWLPIYDRVLLPWLRKFTGKEDGITLLQKMGIGIFLSIITMIVSGVVEDKRRTLAMTRQKVEMTQGKGAISSMSGLWLIPQMALSGLSEAFTLISENEFFYKQCPENMRSIAASFFFVGLAGSSYLSSFLSSVVHKTSNWLAEDLNKGRLDYFYYLIAALEILNLGYFLLCAKWYKYKGGGSDNQSNESKE
ncbi:PREDICTED: protein NRT1/ PTR FAMILY 2.11-like isoform X2 [Nicotiana attenuata]|uniref:Protein nrt1 ptr family 2.11 n=1 Tax=Nicotiana attenuata TaxID=49451 RepID=A0A314KGH4_NICAT|nr:PREDICTED: protein NRT1/ PTR FAMILY 2.11-like isoform X2 [Nicotiana attenuata]OIT28491.1 protein nrt1 ptr family 2.11 [Nicotiana attenuata]